MRGHHAFRILMRDFGSESRISSDWRLTAFPSQAALFLPIRTTSRSLAVDSSDVESLSTFVYVDPAIAVGHHLFQPGSVFGPGAEVGLVAHFANLTSGHIRIVARKPTLATA